MWVNLEGRLRGGWVADSTPATSAPHGCRCPNAKMLQAAQHLPSLQNTQPGLEGMKACLSTTAPILGPHFLN